MLMIIGLGLLTASINNTAVSVGMKSILLLDIVVIISHLFYRVRQYTHAGDSFSFKKRMLATHSSVSFLAIVFTGMIVSRVVTAKLVYIVAILLWMMAFVSGSAVYRRKYQNRL